MKTKEICEQHGFKIVHGIIDSIYIQKKNITEQKVRQVCREIELEAGLPVSFEGIFRWIVFLPSVNNIERPVPTHYYGVFSNRNIKVRGIETRQKSTPKIVRHFQTQVLEHISRFESEDQIKKSFPELCSLLKKTVEHLPESEPELLAAHVRISKTDYKHNIPQKKTLKLLKNKGITVLPGQRISYMYSDRGIALPQDHENPDIEEYSELLVRALYVVLQPFDFTKKQIRERISDERQTKIQEHTPYLYPSQKKVQVPSRII
jgi:DNA polymerase-2